MLTLAGSVVRLWDPAKGKRVPVFNYPDPTPTEAMLAPGLATVLQKQAAHFFADTHALSAA